MTLGTNLIFIGPFSVPAGTSRVLSYNVRFASGIAGGSTRTNMALGYVGNAQIGTNTSSPTPPFATATVSVQAAPAASNLTASTTAGSPTGAAVATGVLAGCAGVGVSVSSVGGATHGSVSLTSPNATFTPADNYSGSGANAGTYTYTCRDDLGQTATATVTVTITPVAVNDSISTTANTAVTTNGSTLVSNDHGTSLTVTAVGSAVNGTVALNGGNPIFTPTAGFSGTGSYQYTATDGSGQTTTATVTVTVSPVAVDDSYNTPFETPLIVPAGTGVLVNDIGSSLSVRAPRPISGPSNGTLTLNADGSFTYRPNNGFAGADTFTYKATDGTSDSNTATVTINVAMPGAPVATNKSATTIAGSPSGAPVTTNVMAGDTGYNISLTGITNGTNGTTVNNGDGTVTYTPDDNFSGVDTYTYTITDGFGRTSTATVTVTVTPVAVDDVASTTAGSPTGVPVTTNVVANDHGSSLSVTNLTNGSNGTTVNNGDGTVTYTPDDNFSGVDTYTYTVDDGTSTSNTATVTVTVAPVAVDDEYNTAFETPLTVPAGTGVLVGDFGSSLSVQAPRPISGPSNGTLTLNADGSFTYTPSNGFAGDDTFTYKATDGTSDSNTATVTIHVAPPAGPVATDKNAVTTAGSPSGSPVTTNVMAGDTGYNISLTSITNGTNGTTVDNGDGTVTYTPDDNFSGVDTYTYTITDGFGRTSTATVTVTVTPVAVNDTASTTAGSPTGVPVTTNVVANDHGSSLSVTNLTNGSNGTTVNNGHGTVTYTPGNNFSGVDTYTYTVNDGTSTSNTATVTVTVTPTAVDDLTSTGPNTPIDIDVLANDHGTSLTVQSVTAPPSGGTATIVANEVRYTPPFNFSGYDVFTYTIVDSSGGTATAVIQVYVPGPGSGLVNNNQMVRFGLGGTTPGSGPGTYDQSNLTAPYAIGTQQLVISLRDGFVPTPGQTFDIVTAPSVTGAYEKVVGQVLSNGVVLDVRYLPTGVRLVAMQGYFVSSTADVVDVNPGDNICATGSGVCTLRAAVMESNASGGGAVVLAPYTTYVLSIAGSGENAAASGDLDLTAPTAVVGQGSSIAGSGFDRVFQVLPSAGTATFRTLTVSGGSASSGAGGIQIDGGSAWLTDVALTNHAGVDGGGLGVFGGSTSMVRGRLASNTATNGGGASVDNATLSLDSVAAVESGAASQNGGGISVTNGGQLSVRSTTIRTNTAAADGGGIVSDGTSSVTLVFTAVTGNTANRGGGLSTGGMTSLTDSRIYSNTAVTGAGAANAGTFSVLRVTFGNNIASGQGGGILNTAGSFTLDTSTISTNTAASGSAFAVAGGGATIRTSTITLNTNTVAGPAVVAAAGSPVSTWGSIIANQAAGTTGCSRVLTTLGYNLWSDTTCGATNTTRKDAVVANALLGPLANNGGFSPTHVPQTGSPAINKGPITCTGPDQRNWPRRRGSACEKGSVEV